MENLMIHLPNAHKPQEKSKLDFSVSSVPIYTESEDSMATVPDYFALKRDDDGAVLNIVGSRYSLVQNSEFFGVVDSALAKALPHHEPVVKERVSKGGRFSAKDYMYLDITGDLPSEVGDTRFRLYGRNSFGSGAMRLYGGCSDMLCKNMELWNWSGDIVGHDVKMIHTPKYADILEDNIVNIVHEALDRFETRMNLYLNWTKHSVNEKMVWDYLERKFSERAVEWITEQYAKDKEKRGQNLFAFSSALTAYATHGNIRGGEDAEENSRFARSTYVDGVISSPEFAAAMIQAA